MATAAAIIAIASCTFAWVTNILAIAACIIAMASYTIASATYIITRVAYIIAMAIDSMISANEKVAFNNMFYLHKMVVYVNFA